LDVQQSAPYLYLGGVQQQGSVETDLCGDRVRGGVQSQKDHDRACQEQQQRCPQVCGGARPDQDEYQADQGPQCCCTPTYDQEHGGSGDQQCVQSGHGAVGHHCPGLLAEQESPDPYGQCALGQEVGCGWAGFHDPEHGVESVSLHVAGLACQEGRGHGKQQGVDRAGPQCWVGRVLQCFGQPWVGQGQAHTCCGNQQHQSGRQVEQCKGKGSHQVQDFHGAALPQGNCAVRRVGWAQRGCWGPCCVEVVRFGVADAVITHKTNLDFVE